MTSLTHPAPTHPTSFAQPGFPDPMMIPIEGKALAVYEFGTRSTDSLKTRPPIILLHGWPEIAYSWKLQGPALAEAGFHVFAIDLPGFGASETLDDVASSGVGPLTERFSKLLDALNYEQAIWCGHDWGGSLIWGMGVLQPARTAGLIGLCTPHLPTPPAPPITILRKRFSNHYFVRFQDADTAEGVFTGKEEEFFKFMFRRPSPRQIWDKLLPDILDVMTRFEQRRPIADEELIISNEDISVYANAYKHSGYTGGINLYRNVDANWSIMKGQDQQISLPSLRVAGELDLFLPPESAAKMPDLFTNLETQTIAGCGHWMMWEKPAELNHLLCDWLNRTF